MDICNNVLCTVFLLPQTTSNLYKAQITYLPNLYLYLFCIILRDEWHLPERANGAGVRLDQIVIGHLFLVAIAMVVEVIAVRIAAVASIVLIPRVDDRCQQTMLHSKFFC